MPLDVPYDLPARESSSGGSYGTVPLGRLYCAAPGAGSVYGHWQGRERGPGQCLRRDASVIVQRHPQPSALSALAERKVDSDRLLALSSTQSAFRSEEHTSELQSLRHLVC